MSRIQLVAVVVASLALSMSCRSAPAPRPAEPSPQAPSPQEAYQAAVEDARDVQASEIVSTLWALKPGEGELRWNDQGQVLMVAWTDWAGYDEAVGGSMEVGRDVWVTPAPQLQAFCQQQQGAPGLTVRLEQYLGLPPGGIVRTRVVEMWVAPEAMFRPCPDPEIDDNSCQLDFPEGVSEAHRAWITERDRSMSAPDAYPWTRLGYTYDWGQGEHVGASEYVVRQGSAVQVEAVTDTDAYCGR